MSTREKRLEKARENPKNVTPEELAVLLESYEFERHTGKSSHRQYRYSKGGLTLQVGFVHNKPHVNQVYVKDAVGKIDQVREHTRE